MATEITTTSWSGFYDNETLVNSTNWSKYFGALNRNGTNFSAQSSGEYFGGFQPKMQNDGSIQISTPGYAFFNTTGIYQDYASITLSALGGGDIARLVYFKNDGNTVKIYEEKNISSTVDGAKSLLYHYYQSIISSYTNYGMPIFYQIQDIVFDLRRFAVNSPNPSAGNNQNYTYSSSASPTLKDRVMGMMAGIDTYSNAYLQAYGGFGYNLTIPSGCIASNQDIYMTPGCSNEPTRITITNQKSSAVTVRLWKYFPFLGLIDIDYAMVSDWTSGTHIYSKSLAAGDTMALILIPMTMIADSVVGVKFTYAVISA